MNFKSLLIFVFSVLLMTSCAESNSNSKDKTSTKDSSNTENTSSKKGNSNTENKLSAKAEENLVLVQSFLAARNSYDTEKLSALTNENYQESFKNDFVEVKDRAQFLTNLEWAKEMNSSTTVKEVVSGDDASIVVIEESTNYIDVALKRKPRNFKTTYYLEDGKVQRQSFDNAPGEKFDKKANDLLYGEFERYCKVNNISYSWNPNKKDGKLLREALEKFANRKE